MRAINVSEGWRWRTSTQPAIVTEASAGLLRAAETRTQQTPKQLELDVQWGQKQAVKSAAMEATRDRPVSLRRKAHREQFELTNGWWDV